MRPTNPLRVILRAVFALAQMDRLQAQSLPFQARDDGS